jgi:hypothetical protein
MQSILLATFDAAVLRESYLTAWKREEKVAEGDGRSSHPQLWLHEGGIGGGFSTNNARGDPRN